MSTISKPYTFSAGATIIASEHNSNFDTIYNDYNGSITNVNLSASAGIVYSKLVLTGSVVNADINSSAAIPYSKLNLAGTIVNADVSTSAAIVDTKLSVLTSGSKVSGTALYSLASIPVGAGVIPSANISSPTVISFSVHNNGTGINMDSPATATLITWSTELWDTNSNFASSKFTPTSAGKYLLSSAVTMVGNLATGAEIAIYKNGSLFKSIGPGIAAQGFEMATVVDANGSSDYFEVYMLNTTVNSDTDGTATKTWFCGSRVF